MKWGSKFPADYVNRLYGMVSRNLSFPFRFICFTDDAKYIHPQVEIQTLPELALPKLSDSPKSNVLKNTPERGWRKLTVFAKGFGGLSGRTLFLDLDVVIVGALDDFFTVAGDFFIAHDKKTPEKMQGNSSVFRFEPGQHPQILTFFEQNFHQIKKQVRHEQAYLSNEMHKRGKLKFWQDDWVPSFKYRCCPSWTKSWFEAPSIPNNARIILFHGLPNPAEAIKGISGKWYRHIQPSPWIADYWKTL